MSGLFGKKEPPPIKPPAPMPDMQDPAIMAAERKRKAGMVATGGRRNTLLSTGGDAGAGSGFGEYTTDRMG